MQYWNESIEEMIEISPRDKRLISSNLFFYKSIIKMEKLGKDINSLRQEYEIKQNDTK